GRSGRAVRRLYLFVPVPCGRGNHAAMSAPRAAAQLLRLPVSLGNSFRPLVRRRGPRSAPSPHPWVRGSVLCLAAMTRQGLLYSSCPNRIQISQTTAGLKERFLNENTCSVQRDDVAGRIAH